MQVSELIGLPVRDNGSHHIGTVIDARLTVTEDSKGLPSQPQLLGLLVNPRSRSSFLGYERSAANAPRLLFSLLQWRHRDTFLAAWEDIDVIDTDAVRLRKGYVRYSPVLRDSETEV
ncbi:hypothetical protein [Mycobacterium sp. URHB0044]|jgi:hypothetical protein|uniref:hypothetical protein n=1 Tax=Mycobacterium sp. URHB0044 TaxID=1380386 RepID=UPI00048EE791|nr:hypothetical protein [Mycobacterium sp. URHB0044]